VVFYPTFNLIVNVKDAVGDDATDANDRGVQNVHSDRANLGNTGLESTHGIQCHLSPHCDKEPTAGFDAHDGATLKVVMLRQRECGCRLHHYECVEWCADVRSLVR
jgi:hypothetical protein